MKHTLPSCKNCCDIVAHPRTDWLWLGSTWYQSDYVARHALHSWVFSLLRSCLHVGLTLICSNGCRAVLNTTSAADDCFDEVRLALRKEISEGLTSMTTADTATTVRPQSHLSLQSQVETEIQGWVCLGTPVDRHPCTYDRTCL